MNHQSTTIGRWILLAAILASGMAFLDGTVVYLALPTIQKALNTDVAGLQWLINAYTLTLAAFLLLGGALGDHFGRRRVFSLGIILFALASLGCSLASGIDQLIFWRAIQGLGAAIMIPGSLALIHTTFPSEKQGAAIGLWSGFSGGIAAAGPFIGGWLIEQYSWQSIFSINVILSLIVLLITFRFVPESKREESGKLDFLGSLLTVVSLTGLSYFLIEGPAKGWLSPLIIGSLGIGLVTLVLFGYVEKHAKNPMIPFSIFRSPLVVGANLSTLLLYFVLNGIIFLLVLNLQGVQDLSPLQASLALLPFTLLITFLSGPAGKLADRIGPRLPMFLASLLIAASMLLLIIPDTTTHVLWFLPGITLYGLAMALLIAPLTKSALAVGSQFSGAASGVNNAVARIAALFAIALFGLVLSQLFGSKLEATLGRQNIAPSAKQAIISQSARLTAIELPVELPQEAKAKANSAVDESFVFAYRWLLGGSAFLALLSALVVWRFILPSPQPSHELANS